MSCLAVILCLAQQGHKADALEATGQSADLGTARPEASSSSDILRASEDSCDMRSPEDWPRGSSSSDMRRASWDSLVMMSAGCGGLVGCLLGVDWAEREAAGVSPESRDMRRASEARAETEGGGACWLAGAVKGEAVGRPALPSVLVMVGSPWLPPGGWRCLAGWEAPAAWGMTSVGHFASLTAERHEGGRRPLSSS